MKRTKLTVRDLLDGRGSLQRTNVFVETAREAAAAEEERLQRLRVAGFAQYVSEVQTGAFPAEEHVVHVDHDAAAAFGDAIDDVKD